MSLDQYARRIDLAIAVEEDPDRVDTLIAYQRLLERAIETDDAQRLPALIG